MVSGEHLGSAISKATSLVVRIAFAAYTLAAGLAFAADSLDARFQHLYVADGLSQGSIQAITQDRHGFIWFGTQHGLNRWDGVNFKTYLHSSTNPKSLPSNWIWALHIDASGTLWVGSLKGGLAYFDEIEGSFISVGDNTQDIRDITEGLDGVLWFAANEDGVIRYDKKVDRFNQLSLDELHPDASNSKTVHADALGNVWLGTTGAGLLRKDALSQRFSTVPEFPTHVQITELTSRGTELWIATESDGLFLLDTATSELTEFTRIASKNIQALYTDPKGTVWVGHDTKGLNQITPQREVRWSSRHTDDRRSLADNHVRAVFQDRSGLLWVGTQNGASFWNQDSLGFTNFSQNANQARTLSGNWISGFAEESPTTIWVAIYGGGMNRVDLLNDSVTHYLHNPAEEQGLPDDRVLSVAYFQDNHELWAGTRDHGISVLQADGRWRHYRHDTDDSSSLSTDVVSGLFIDAEKRLWIATMGGGVNLYDPVTDGFTHFRHNTADPSSLCSDRILDIYQDRAGVLWFATFGADFCRLDEVTGEFQTFTDLSDAQALAAGPVNWIVTEDKDGHLWIGSENTGVHIWLAEDRAADIERFHHFDSTKGMVTDVVYGLEPDAQGGMWVGSNRGLTRYLLDVETLNLAHRHYSVEDGLPGDEFNLAAHMRASNGKLIFGGTAGLTVFQPELQNRNLPTLPVVLTEFRKVNEAVPFDIAQPGFTIDHNDQLISFDYTAMEFAAPRKIRYQHRLAGFETDWVSDGNASRATYTNLAPGEYLFEARAARESDAWGPAIRVPLTVSAPPWATSQAYGLYSLAFALLAFLIYRSWTNRLRVAHELSSMNQALLEEIELGREKELALQQARQQIQQYLDVAEVPIIALDADNRIAMINNKGARLIGREESDLLGEHFIANFVPQSEQQGVQAALAQVRQYSYSESRLISADGTERLIAWHNVRLSAEDIPPNGLLLSGSDVTQMRKLEHQLRDGQKMEALGTLARGVAHDFNNILSAILGYSELTRSNLGAEAEAHAYLSRLEDSVLRARDIVQSILTFGRAQQLPLEVVNLPHVIADAIHLVRPIVPANVRLVEHIADEDIPVLANPAQLIQMVLNLCTNACQAMEHGGQLQISLDVEELDDEQARASGQLMQGRHALFTVKDTGPGMDDYTYARMFEPFFTTRNPGEGSGLGLSVVHGVVTQCAGTIDVQTGSQGTEFAIRLPYSSEPLPDQTVAEPAVEYRGAHETILFVDDETDVAEIAQLNLTAAGYHVITANNGPDAVRILQTNPAIDLLVTDQTMPDMRGKEVAAVAKTLYPHMPVLLISGADEADTDDIDDFLPKPYNNPLLLEKLRSLLSKATEEY